MPHTIFGLDPLWVSTVLLVLAYVTIMTDRLNRAVVALLGAGLMIVTGILSQDEAIRGVDFNTIGLLAGMMLIVGITRRSGVFEYVAIWSAKVVKANPAGVLALLSIVTAVFSAFLDNVTTVLLIVPVTFAICRELKVPPYPFLFNQIIASNIGGTATLIGDPPNIIIGSAANLAFDQFVVNLAPVILVVLAVQVLITHLVWGRKLHAAPEDRARVMAMDERAAITDWKLLKQALGVLAAVIDILARKLVAATGGEMTTMAFTVLWASAILSAIIDNIPFVATMIPIIKGMAPVFGGAEHLLPLWWALALGACLGGNGSLIGASANLIVAGTAERQGVPFQFRTFTMTAFPLMLISVAISHVY